MKHPMIVPLTLCLTAAYTITATSAVAATPDLRGEPSIRIDTHRMDLTQPDVVAQLYTRIKASARMVCRDSTSSSDTGRVAALQRCYNATVEIAVSSARAPLLTALHEESTRTRTLAQAGK